MSIQKKIIKWKKKQVDTGRGFWIGCASMIVTGFAQIRKLRFWAATWKTTHTNSSIYVLQIMKKNKRAGR